MRAFFSSQAAKTKGSYNLAGISDPIIDALIDKIIAAQTRAELTTACRAFDRVFRAGRYWVPQWYELPLQHPNSNWDQISSHPRGCRNISSQGAWRALAERNCGGLSACQGGSSSSRRNTL